MLLNNFIGGSYQSQSPLADYERTYNWIPENIESPGAPTRLALYPTPGIQTITTGVPSGRAFAHYAMEGREFAVIDTTFWEFDRYGGATNRGTVALGSQPATICSTGKTGGQLMITAGRNVYIFNIASAAFAQVAAMNGLATMGDEIDGYFLVLDSNTGTFYWSNLNDGLTWQPSVNFANRNKAPDGWVSMKVASGLIWLFGTRSSEVWYDAGTYPAPFTPYVTEPIPYGIAAQFAPAVADGVIYWISATPNGRSTVCKSIGPNHSVISTYALSNAIQGYSRRNDAVGDTYTSLGHTFYLLSFPEANATICYDANTSLWHDRGTWINEESRFISWRPRFHALAFDQHRWLDSQTGALYWADESLTGDVDGRAIRRIRTPPAMFSQNQRLFVNSFELYPEIGLGNAVDPASNPQIMLRISKDGGKTWGNERWKSAGKAGEYSTRCRWDRCGQGRRMVFEISVSDGIPWRILGASVSLAQPPAGISQLALAQGTL